MREVKRANRNWQRATIALCVPVLIIATLSQPALANPGDPDGTFGMGGTVITPFSTYNAGVNSVAVRTSNGKIVVAGHTESANADKFALARYKVSGALDPSFHSDGKVSTSVGPSFDGARAVAIQPNGKTVAAGFAVIGSKTVFALVRYKKNGQLDPKFHFDGKVTTPIGSGANASSIAIQPNGKIVVAGEALIGPNNEFAVARYKKNGKLDLAFSGNGKVTTPIGLGDAHARSVAIQSNGMIVAGGDAQNGSNVVFALARYDTSGALDTANFGTGGTVLTPPQFPTANANAYSIAIQSDQKIVAGGQLHNGTSFEFALARYDTSGALDTGFGTGGMVTTPFIGGDASAFSVAIQPDQKIVAAGQAVNGNINEFALARYDTSGVLDTTNFGTGGTVTTPFAGDANARSVAIQPDGQIVAAGQWFNGNNYEFALVRYDD